MSWISWQDSSAGNRAQRVISVAMIHLRNGKSVGTRTPWFLFIILRIPANAYTQASISRAHLAPEKCKFLLDERPQKGLLKKTTSWRDGWIEREGKGTWCSQTKNYINIPLFASMVFLLWIEWLLFTTKILFYTEYWWNIFEKSILEMKINIKVGMEKWRLKFIY